MSTALDLAPLVCPACHAPLEAQESACRCTACDATFPRRDGFLDLHARAEDESELATEVSDANESYHDVVADEYEDDTDTEEIFGEDSQARLRSMLATLASECGNELLLDLGCGTGNVLVVAREQFQRTLGVDVSIAMMKHARDRGLDCLRANAYRLPLPDASVNVATGFAFLHHIQDVPALLREVYRVLRPGGAFYTDWDPNSKMSYGLVRVVRHPLVYDRAKAVWRALTGASKDEAYHHEAGETDTFRLAEYHAFGVSCDADRIAKAARAAGFDDLLLRYHANPPSLETDDWSKLSRSRRLAMRARGLLAGQFSRDKLLPLFLLVARKPR